MAGNEIIKFFNSFPSTSWITTSEIFKNTTKLPCKFSKYSQLLLWYFWFVTSTSWKKLSLLYLNYLKITLSLQFKELPFQSRNCSDSSQARGTLKILQKMRSIIVTSVFLQADIYLVLSTKYITWNVPLITENHIFKILLF